MNKKVAFIISGIGLVVALLSWGVVSVVESLDLKLEDLGDEWD